MTENNTPSFFSHYMKESFQYKKDSQFNSEDLTEISDWAEV